MRAALLGLCRGLQVLGYVALGLWLLACPLLWILRDGLGPDSVETTGWAAVRKFAPVLGIGLGVAGALVMLHVWTARLAATRGRGGSPE
jgi:hypothetical protein